MVKRKYFLFFFFLVSCAPAASPISAFEINSRCPRVCWLGINPDVTSAEEARSLLRKSNQIDQKNFHRSDDGISTHWLTGKIQTLPWNVGIYFEQTLVKSISFGGGAPPLQLKDFIELVGEPDQISIEMTLTPDAQYVSYVIYYTQEKIIIYVAPARNNSPDPNDTIMSLILNQQYENNKWPFWLADYNKYRQLWIGYGHQKDYLPEIP